MSVVQRIRNLGEKFAQLSLEYVPDPYVLVIFLTVVAFVGALAVGASPQGALDAWYGGVWTFLGFMAAFSVTLMAGDAIAKSPAATKTLERLADIPDTPFTAVWFVAFVAMASALISWALGLIVGAVMARQVAYRGKQKGLSLHYPLLAAAGYTALMIWHSGLTSSAALIMTDPSLIPKTFPKYAMDGIPITKTLGSLVNIVTVILLLIVVPPVMAALHPADKDRITEIPQNVFEEMTPATEGGADRVIQDDPTAEAGHTEEQTGRETFAEKLNRSKVFGLVIAIFPAYYFINAWVLSGAGLSGLTLNSINAFFLFAAMVLWKTPIRIVEQMQESADTVAQIIFQFPFYAGISGLLTGTALAEVIANFFASFATPLTWPVIGLISAGIVNIFVPSGGGQWVAQGPILLETTKELGMPLQTAVLIEMMGDQLTNMIQPFWALPLLALADLRARDIIGYSTVAMLAGFVVMAITMTLFVGMGFP